ncbi:MAG: 6-phosphofructokinase [Clostridia bacterium]|nr:6-phosphofructokinase [Clostridia bacterium]
MNRLIGNAVVGQSGGPTAAINATLAGVIKGAMALRDEGVIEKLYGMRNGIEGTLDERFSDLFEIFSDEEKLNDLISTPAAALGSCRKKLPEPCEGDETFVRLIEIFKKYNIRYFFYIGGNDSMDTVKKLSTYTKLCGYEMRVVGVPKTIDNDLPGTDHSPGYGSAAKYIAATTQEIIRDCAVYTVKAVTIIEIMGRDAGWLAASAAAGRHICGAEPDLVYLPERSFDMDRFISDVKNALDKHPNVVVAVSEGIRLADGRYVGEATQSGVSDVFGHKYLSGSGKTLELAVKEAIGCKVRSIELNLCQRCASHIASLTDLEESVLVGKTAVLAAADGASKVMMTIDRVSTDPYEIKIGTADVDNVANKESLVPDDFINEEGNGVTDKCLDYILPLIKGEVNPRFKNGLPVHIVI